MKDKDVVELIHSIYSATGNEVGSKERYNQGPSKRTLTAINCPVYTGQLLWARPWFDLKWGHIGMINSNHSVYCLSIFIFVFKK